jgi:hypothetical protein
MHHGLSDGKADDGSCSVLLGPDGHRCGCPGYQAGEAP